MSEQRLDIILFGASGFTGTRCIPFLYDLCKKNEKNLTWGVCGRSEAKLKNALYEISKEIGADLSHIPIIITDINDLDSLKLMAKRAKVLINCVGPYKLLGYAVVEACIDANTHHIDVTAEPEFIETLWNKYQQAASKKGVYIVTTCGLDCIPSDMGLTYLEEKFDGVLNSAVAYVKAWKNDWGFLPSSPTIGYGTWSSLVYALDNETTFTKLKNRMFPDKKPTLFYPELKVNYLPHNSAIVNGWSLVYPAADKIIMRKSQKYFNENENKRPIQVETLCNIKKSLFILLSVVFLIWIIMAKFKFGRYLLLNYPKVFTYGLVSKNDFPSKEIIEKSWYQISWFGEGWNEKSKDKDYYRNVLPNKSVVAKLTVKNGYRFTGASAVLSAIMILTEKDKMPQNGGTYTPSAAFGKTSLMKRLMENKTITFDVISIKNL